MTLLAALDALARELDGPLLRVGDVGFDAARRPWNLAIEQRPAAVATPAGLDDLRRILAAARESGTPIAVQPSGHGASGDLVGSVIVRTAAFDRLEVDLASGVVVVGSGVRWGAVVDALEGTAWAAPAGTSPVVSVAGYTLGGGHSWFSRTAGLGSDNLRAAWVLRPDGTHERIDDESDAEAMWALRGAGGVVGIVTALEIDLVPAPAQWGASLTFAMTDAASVIRAVRDLSAAAPSTLNVFTSSNRMPDAPMLPEEIRGRSFVTVRALSTDGAADALLDGVRAAGAVQREITGPTSPAAIAAALGEPTEPTAGRGASLALDTFDDALIDALVAFHQAPEQSPIMSIDLRMLGGALDAPRRPGFASLASASWLLHALVPNFPGAPSEPGDASIAGILALLAPAAAEQSVPTFLDPGQTLERCGTAADIDRLRAVRASADPDGVLHEGRLPR
ncbi:MAG: FAD-binding oxidoreductase [Actinobacteria bacterium]|nr:FAD-binding oxidoreductase [Actinomycetota bacterium]